MTDRTEVVVVAAMEREIAPLVRGWNVILGPSYRCFEKDRVLVVPAGIGPAAARKAADMLLTYREPSVVISAGFAGALRESLSIGTLFVPTKVLSTESEQTFRIEGGAGTLVSTGNVVGPEEKRDFGKTHSADAVDMEAAFVAEVAQRKGVRFVAVKAISDVLDFELPPFGRFIDDRGEFRKLRFALHAAVQPGMWLALGRLKRNSDKAATALCNFLAGIKGAADVDNRMRTAQAS